MDNNTILIINKLKKSFGVTRALQGVNFEIKKGEIHGIVGENGAGKSTLVKTIMQEIKADEGQIKFKEVLLNGSNPWEVQKKGIRLVHQNLNIISSINVVKNILLGKLPEKNLGFLDWNRGYQKAKEVVHSINPSINLEEKAGNLRAAQKQLIILARALIHDPKILILDEPTSRLGMEESNQLFNLLKRLKEKDVTIIYITHRLEEIYRICDRVSVLRNGKKILTSPTSDISANELVHSMVGREVKENLPKHEMDPGENVLNVENLHFTNKVKGVSFQIKSREVVGLVGTVGAGKSEILNTIFGAEKHDKGTLKINKEKVSITHPSQAIDNQIGLVPEDRNTEGLILDFTIKDNITLVDLEQFSGSMGIINKAQEKDAARKSVKELQITPPDISRKAYSFSGGNQQKIVLGKWLLGNRNIYLFDEVTAGIDVGAKYEIYNLINELVKNGAAILLATSDIREAMGICDRLLVIHRGKIVKELIPKNTTREEVLTYMMGGEVE